jgi:predicted metal-dependent hydrolase
MRVSSLEALVVRKAVKNVHLSVMPPNGSVRVTAPVGMRDDVIRVLLATRLAWIRKQQEQFAGQSRQSAREYVSGESHYLWGRRYRLILRNEEGQPKLETRRNGTMILTAKSSTSFARREAIVTGWYRDNLRLEISKLIDFWCKKMRVRPELWSIRRMKTRWGTCNHSSRRILFNLELAKKPIKCVEYVVVHELAHLIERRHNDRFMKILSSYLPDWKSRRDELNKFILAHEEW